MNRCLPVPLFVVIAASLLFGVGLGCGAHEPEITAWPWPAEASWPDCGYDEQTVAFMADHYAIGVRRLDGSGRKVLLTNQELMRRMGYDKLVAFYRLDLAPNKRWLVFSIWSAFEERDRVFALSCDGKELRALQTAWETSTRAPVIAPDGEQVVYTEWESGLYVANVDDGSRRRLVAGPGAPEVRVFSPSGTEVAGWTTTHLQLIDVQSGAVQPVCKDNSRADEGALWPEPELLYISSSSIRTINPYKDKTYQVHLAGRSPVIGPEGTLYMIGFYEDLWMHEPYPDFRPVKQVWEGKQTREVGVTRVTF